MKKLILILGLAMLIPARASWAQVAAPNAAGVSMGHVHFMVQDVDAAKTFWTAMGGVPGKLGPNEVFKFPGVLILVRKGDATAPSVGSVVGHIGFHVPDTTAALARWKAAGLNTEVGQNPGQGFVWTPDHLTRVEILEEKTQTVPIAFHHVHFYIADTGSSNVLEMQSWYAKMFGAKPGKRGQFDAADLPGANLTFTKSDTPTVTTKGRMLDHIGFRNRGARGVLQEGGGQRSKVRHALHQTTRPGHLPGVYDRSVGHVYRAERRPGQDVKVARALACGGWSLQEPKPTGCPSPGSG